MKLTFNVVEDPDFRNYAKGLIKNAVHEAVKGSIEEVVMAEIAKVTGRGLREILADWIRGKLQTTWSSQDIKTMVAVEVRDQVKAALEQIDLGKVIADQTKTVVLNIVTGGKK